MNGAIEAGFQNAIQELPGFGDVVISLGCSANAPAAEATRVDIYCDDNEFKAGTLHLATVNFALVTPAYIDATAAEVTHREMAKSLHDLLSSKARLKAEFRSDQITMVGGNISKSANRRDDGVWIFEATMTCSVLSGI